MIWISIASGFAGGLAFAIISVPLVLRLARDVLQTEVEQLVHDARSRFQSLSKASSRPDVTQPSASQRPSPVPPSGLDGYSFGDYRHQVDVSYPVSLSGWPDL